MAISQQEAFFKEKDFESYSSQPRLLEYLQKFITNEDSQTDTQRDVLEKIQVETRAKKYGIDVQDTARGYNNESDILRKVNRLAKLDSGLEIEYPKVSFLSIEDHKTFIEEFEKAVKGVYLDDTKKKIIKVRINEH
jgi:hypothetical protein